MLIQRGNQKWYRKIYISKHFKWIPGDYGTFCLNIPGLRISRASGWLLISIFGIRMAFDDPATGPKITDQSTPSSLVE